jgi:DNA polymerase (family 10)
LVGVEANITKSGDVDTPPKHAKELDYVIGSVHSHFTLEAKEQTARVLKAIDSGTMTILGHPQARLIGRREAISVDWEKVFQHARDANVILELNSFPNRLDLNGELAKAAKDRKCRFAIDTDAHATDHLALMPFGVAQARRGWLEAKDVVNALPFAKAAQALAR